MDESGRMDAETMVATAPITRTMGGELVEFGEGRAVLRFPVLPQYMNPLGQLQGGIFGVLMDTAMAVAARGLATATMQISIFRPVTGGHVIVTGTVVKAGRSIIYCEAEVHDAEGRLVARGNQNGVRR